MVVQVSWINRVWLTSIVYLKHQSQCLLSITDLKDNPQALRPRCQLTCNFDSRDLTTRALIDTVGGTRVLEYSSTRVPWYSVVIDRNVAIAKFTTSPPVHSSIRLYVLEYSSTRVLEYHGKR